MTTSWDASGKWYNTLVGEKGHYYHQKIVIPNVIRLLALKEDSSLLDLACGQAVLARALPKHVSYHGIDLSSALIKSAKKQTKHPFCTFSVADICKPYSIKNQVFSHACSILALQNLAHPENALKQAASHLAYHGVLVLVLNHPCFRIPRQTHWVIDERQKIKYRRIDRYMSSLKIPIQTHPGKGKGSETTWTFHHPLSEICRWLFASGFVITELEEWVSDKKSTGSKSKMENSAREEFPLFLAVKALKLNSLLV